MSLDGHLLNQLGEEATESGGYYSKLLQEYDAVLLSSTSLAEKSSFPFSKEPGANQPLKIVLSKYKSSLVQIPALKNDSASKLMIVSEKEANVDPQIVQDGTQTLSFDRISLPEILEECKNQGLCSVLLDLTGNDVDFEDILQEGFEKNLFHKVIVEVLPILGCGQERVSKHLDIRAKVRKLTTYASGKSVVLEGYY